jgi:hypothetical protein
MSTHYFSRDILCESLLWLGTFLSFLWMILSSRSVEFSTSVPRISELFVCFTNKLLIRVSAHCSFSKEGCRELKKVENHCSRYSTLWNGFPYCNYQYETSVNVMKLVWNQIMGRRNTHWKNSDHRQKNGCKKKNWDKDSWSQSYQTFFFVKRIFLPLSSTKLGHFNVHTIFSYASNTQA